MSIRLKGKQVQILYDLVTVIKEYKVEAEMQATGKPGR